MAEKILDLLRLVPVANEDRVRRAHDDEIVDAEQCDPRALRIEDDVVRGFERRDFAIRRVPVRVILEILLDGAPAPDIIPIEAGFHYQDAIGFLHDCIIE